MGKVPKTGNKPNIVLKNKKGQTTKTQRTQNIVLCNRDIKKIAIAPPREY